MWQQQVCPTQTHRSREADRLLGLFCTAPPHSATGGLQGSTGCRTRMSGLGFGQCSCLLRGRDPGLCPEEWGASFR